MTATDPRIRRCLVDFLEHSSTVDRLVLRGKPAYDADEMLRYAAEDLLIRLGECVGRIDHYAPEFVDQHPGLELRRVKDTRNLIAHGYGFDYSGVLWAILSTNIPLVAARVRDLLDSTA